jgi:hypothetical protein
LRTSVFFSLLIGCIAATSMSEGASAQHQVAGESPTNAIRNPPLNVYIPTVSEDGQVDMTVIYYGDGSGKGTCHFTMAPISGASAGYALSERDCEWWFEPDGTFSFKILNGARAGKVFHKSGGRLIGRTTLNGGQLPADAPRQ